MDAPEQSESKRRQDCHFRIRCAEPGGVSDQGNSRIQVQQLFLSVHWISGNYPERLYKALMNSSTVLTVWDGEKLVGLTRVLDDTEMLAQIHYVLVHPDYQGQGIAGKMIEHIKEKYKNFLYIEGIPEDKNNVPFYEKHGFSVMKNGAAIQICNLT